MKQLDINALGKMAQTLLVAGVTQKNVPATINRLVKIIDPDYGDKAMPSTLEIATFESDFDDGSSFRSPCIIDTKNKTIVYIASAGCSSDDAACISQTIMTADYNTYMVNNPDEEIYFDNGYTIV